MDKEAKITLIEKLVSEKRITFREGLMLMETEKEYIYSPYPYITYTPPIYPNSPIYCNGTTAKIDGFSCVTNYCLDLNTPFTYTTSN